MQLFVYVVVQIVKDLALVFVYAALAVERVPIDIRAAGTGRVAAGRLVKALDGVAQLLGAVSNGIGRVDDILLAGREAILHVGYALAAVVEHIHDVGQEIAGHRRYVQRRLRDRCHGVHDGNIGAQVGFYILKLLVQTVQRQGSVAADAGEHGGEV